MKDVKKRYRVYQIDPAAPGARDVIFKPLSGMAAAGYPDPPADKYRLVHDGDVGCHPAAAAHAVLELIFQACNDDARPAGYTGRSLSVSDVVELYDDQGNDWFFYCDPVGFAAVPFDKTKALPMP